MFFNKSAVVLPKHTKINTYAINLDKGKQSSYGSIYSLELMELKTLKTYIITNLSNGFIHPLKSSAGAPILFNEKFNWSLRVCVDYRGLNNITIKNRDPLLLINKFFNCLSRAKQFIQLDLTSAY